MWSIASHAGAGVAIAGLSATYYALARKNCQLERETIMRGGRSDADRGNLWTPRSDMISISKSQSLLLKTELANLSRGSGHSIGLNVVEHRGEPFEDNMNPPIQPKPSGLNIRQIVSRGQINFPKNALSIEDLDAIEPPKKLSDDDISKEPEVLTDQIPKGAKKEDDQDSIFGDSQPSQPEEPDDENEEVCEQGDAKQTVKLSPLPSVPYKLSIVSTVVTTQLPVSEDSIKSRRSKSPIIYYKNPGFGKRFACKIQDSDTEFPMVPLPGSDLRSDIRDYRYRGSEENYKDSTQFLFPPVLSESRMSLCEDHDLEVKVEQDVQMEFDRSINEVDADVLAAEGLSGMDQIRDYNLQLQILHDMQTRDGPSDPIPQVHMTFENDELTKTEPVETKPVETKPVETELAKPEITPPEPIIIELPVAEVPELPQTDPTPPTPTEINEPAVSPEPSIMVTEISSCGQEGLEQSDLEFLEPTGIPEFDPIVYELPSIPVTTRPVVMQRVPEVSWMNVPARLYAESEEMPRNVIVFSAVIILLCVLMGKFFLGISDWIAAPFNEDDEVNPSAMLEH